VTTFRAPARSGFVHLALATSGANLAVALGTAVGGVLLARWLGPSERGLYAGVFAWFIMAQIVAELGVFGATVHAIGGRPASMPEIRRRTSRLVLRQSLVTAIAGIGICWLVLENSQTRLTYSVALAALPLVMLASAQQFVLYGLNVRHWNRARLSQVPAYVLGIIVLHLAGALSALTAVLVMIFSTVLIGVVSSRLLRSSSQVSTDPAMAYREFRRYALVNFAWAAPVLVNGRIDQLALTAWAPQHSLGQYVVAVSYISLGVPIVAGFGNALFPLLSRLSARGDDVGALRRRSVAIAAGLSAVLVSLMALAAHWMVPALFGHEYDQAATLALVLAPYGWGIGTRQVAADALRGSGSPELAARGELALLVILVAVIPPVAAFGTLQMVGVCMSCGSAAVATYLVIRACWIHSSGVAHA